jgi:hypothetical protein
LSRDSILNVCLQIEQSSLILAKAQSREELDAWHQILLYSSPNSTNNDKTSVLPDTLVRTIKRCVDVISIVSRTRLKCAENYEIHHLVRELEGYYKQYVEYMIWPNMLKSLSNAVRISDLKEAFEAAETSLSSVFLLNEDIHYLALENVIAAAEASDIDKFRRSRSFFLKCLLNSKYGQQLFDMIDHNGYYMKCTQAI